MRKDVIQLIPIYIMGKKYEVPKGLTIQKALEYSGYKLTRGCGCRGGVCGACVTVCRYIVPFYFYREGSPSWKA